MVDSQHLQFEHKLRWMHFTSRKSLIEKCHIIQSGMILLLLRYDSNWLTISSLIFLVYVYPHGYSCHRISALRINSHFSIYPYISKTCVYKILKRSFHLYRICFYEVWYSRQLIIHSISLIKEALIVKHDAIFSISFAISESTSLSVKSETSLARQICLGEVKIY